MRILILGAGIGGLTVAHMLTKIASILALTEALDILVIERNEQVGGQARSIGRVEDQSHSEYCWHALAERYHILLNVIYELGLMEKLRPFYKYIYALKDSTYVEYELPFITQKSLLKFLRGFYGLYSRLPSFGDLIRLPLTLFYINAVSPERVQDYNDTLWSDYVSKFSPLLKRWLLDSTAIFFGMDYATLGADMMFSRIRQNARAKILDQFERFKNCTYFSFTDNINRAWLDPWKKYLESRDVKFMLNTAVEDITIAADHSITAVRVKNHLDADGSTTLTCDYVFNCLSLETAEKLFPWYQTLSRKSRQLQCQVTAYAPTFAENTNVPQRGSVIIHPDTEWFLMSRVESSFWTAPVNFECLAIGVGIWDTPGTLIKKPAKECRPEEIVDEVLHQVSSSKYIREQLRGTELERAGQSSHATLWYSYVFDEHTGKITTFEPKNTNAVGTWKLRPNPNSTDLFIPNMFQATSYCKTSMNVANMEGAAEAACEAVIAFVKELRPHYSTQEQELRKILHLEDYESPNWFYRILQTLDTWWLTLEF